MWDWDGWKDKPWVPVSSSRPSSDEERGYHEAEKPGQMHPRSHECQHTVVKEAQLKPWVDAGDPSKVRQSHSYVALSN